jgi:GntR family transcriptional regulator, transcriptional repressor for pyruvate dehydrogenase complex
MSKPNEHIFTPVNRGKLTQLVISQIKNLIFSKGIGIGQRLPSERELTTQLKVSRPVVRAALSSLEQSGLVESRWGRGGGSYIVDQLYKPLHQSTMDLLNSGKIDIRQFLEARIAIECFSMKIAKGKITEEHIQRLEAINEEFVKNGKDQLSQNKQNSLFHVALAELSGNSLLTMMLQSLMEFMDETRPNSSRSSSFIKAVYRGHAAIIEAMKQRDWDRCEQLLRVNIELRDTRKR